MDFDLRRAMRPVPTSVTVITAPGPVGMTIGSFASASLTPPLVSFLVGRGSGTWPRLAATGRFCANILAAEQAALGLAFSGSGHDRFAGCTWRVSPLGSPILDGVLAWLDCELEAVHPVGDHLYVVGRVRALHADDAASPLVFVHGRLGALA